MKKDQDQTSAFPEGGMDRRTFLRLTAVLVGGLIGLVAPPVASGIIERLDNYDADLKIDTDGVPGFNFDEAAQLAKRFDECFDHMSEPQVEFDDKTLIGLTLELAPQFQYEKITPRIEWPQAVEFVLFSTGDEANHILGRSDCETFAVLNGRLMLPLSTFADGDAPFTLAHELAHVAQTQGVCYSRSSEEIESSAQIAALEVTSGLALQGNPLWLWATVSELRGMAMSAAYGLALKENRFDDFHDLRKQLSPGALSEARFQKSRRRWSNDPFKLQDTLNKYNTKPLNMIWEAMRNGDEIKDLAFPPVFNSYNMYLATPEPVKIDDLAYLIRNAESLVGDPNK